MTTDPTTRTLTDDEIAVVRWALTSLALDVEKSGRCPDHFAAGDLQRVVELLAHVDNHGYDVDARWSCELVVRHRARCYLLDDDGAERSAVNRPLTGRDA
jgi:hypothetical protein